jgi:hypothetical protein
VDVLVRKDVEGGDRACLKEVPLNVSRDEETH